MYKVGVNFDEISDDIHIALAVMKKQGVTYGELRTIEAKNFVFWTDDEVQYYKTIITMAGIELVAAATPLFKWYRTADSPEVRHDNFGFDPRLREEEKRAVIARTIEIATAMKIPRLRIFSGLGSSDKAGPVFASDPLLHYALELASKYEIDLYLENEPVCIIHNKQDVVDFFNQVTSQHMKYWLDVANLIELNEMVDDAFLSQVIARVGYVHVKDFINTTKGRKYVPVGQGEINYRQILADIRRSCPHELIITIETHAKINKIEHSIASIKGVRLLLKDGEV
ncbi:MAG TPA: TIM barrel protein [Candidatus Dormibacteraeota bacterium]|nr:TIM barrel protein [Candidatus Dormibacteraeota bacterium]